MGRKFRRDRGSLESLFLRAKGFLVFKLFEIVNMERETQAAFGCELTLDVGNTLAFTLIYQVVNVSKVTDCFDVSFIYNEIAWVILLLFFGTMVDELKGSRQ